MWCICMNEKMGLFTGERRVAAAVTMTTSPAKATLQLEPHSSDADWRAEGDFTHKSQTSFPTALAKRSENDILRMYTYMNKECKHSGLNTHAHKKS